MNKLFLVTCMNGGVPEYSVTLIAGVKPVYGEYDQFIRRVIKTHQFDSLVKAQKFFDRVKHITRNRPFAALEQFCGTGGSTKLSKVIQMGQRVRHRVNCPDGTYSIWIGYFNGDNLEREDEKGITTYTTLGQFVSAHCKEVHPTRKKGDGWKECETKMKGNWVRMRVARVLSA